MSMPSRIFKEEHETFRKTVAAFIEREIAPNYERWEKDGQKFSKLKVIGEKLQMLGGRGEGGGGGGGGPRGRSRSANDETGGSYDEGDQYSSVSAPPPNDDIPF